ncbi:twin-arginine translocation signal domain-containing protein [Chelatococcus sp. SYSU_G07232]|uniref:Twin-arginine translocation signal domain-containing protein n=1 Tax=Chelatococcus albus TaxID=3047466 RepID=A0ABT7ALM8_9HYPH|nr:twin-arginine translocation signal domain-containing protein [Chelatococcus sp. SYSU_G07232]MDJ1159847.1 twin-arginine translocation signal domain-containing protein [Chelatococcus sp. SYSU_G07232]
MRRRDFLKAGAVATGAGASAIAAPAIAQSMPEVRWRLTSSFPKSLDALFGNAEAFARYVAEATDNRFQIQCFGPGEIVPALQAMDAAANGTVDCAHTPIYFYIGKESALAFGTGVPFSFNSRLQYAWLVNGGGNALMDEALTRFNVVGFPCGQSGTQMGGWFRKEIKEPSDWQCLKFRIGGLGGQVLARLGVVPQQIGGGDIYPALERGTIDAAEFVSPYDDEKLGFARVAKYYYAPGFWEGGAMLHMVVNRERWDALPKHYQAVMRQAAEASMNAMLAKYDAFNGPALKRLIAGGTEVRIFPNNVLDAAWKAAHDLYSEMAAQNPLFKRALDSMIAFRTENYLWWQVNEYAFDSYMIRNRTKV